MLIKYSLCWASFITQYYIFSEQHDKIKSYFETNDPKVKIHIHPSFMHKSYISSVPAPGYVLSGAGLRWRGDKPQQPCQQAILSILQCHVQSRQKYPCHCLVNINFVIYRVLRYWTYEMITINLRELSIISDTFQVKHSWSWLCRIGKILSYMRKDFNYLYHVSVAELYNWRHIFMYTMNNLVHKELN